MRWQQSNGEDHINVFLFEVTARKDGESNEQCLQAFTDTLANVLYESGLSAHFHQDASLRDFRWDRVEWVGNKLEIVETYGVYLPSAPLAGAATADTLPHQIAAVGLLRTHSIRTLGRKFVGMLTEASQSGGSWVTALVLDLVEFLGHLYIDGLSAGPGESAAIGTLHSKRGLDWVRIIAVGVSAFAGTIRRRRPRVGS